MNKFLIFTSGRSGSNYLSNTLNLNPSCVCYGEVLGEWNFPYKVFGRLYCLNGKTNAYLDFFYSDKIIFYMAQVYSTIAHLKGKRFVNFKRMNNVRAIGIKDFLVTIERKNAGNYFISQPDIKIIYLHRDNVLKRYISGLFMKENRIHVTYTSIQSPKIKIDIENMLHKLNIYSEEIMREREFIKKLNTHCILDIDYEEYFKSPESIQHWNNLIFNFLEIDCIETTSNQKKILPNTLKDILLNYDQVKETLEGTQYENFLY